MLEREYIGIAQCPVHSNFYGIFVEDKEGSGTRLTPSKCCGQWKTITRWRLNSRMCDDIMDEIATAAAYVEAKAEE